MVVINPLCMSCRLPVRLELSAANPDVLDQVVQGLQIRCSGCNGGKLLLRLLEFEGTECVTKPTGQTDQ